MISDQDIRNSTDVLKEYLEPEEVSRRASKHLQDEPLPYKENTRRDPASTDVGDVSYVVPTAQINVTTETFGSQLHSWQVVSQGKSPIAHEGMIYAAKVMALTGAMVLGDPEALTKIQEEFNVNIPGYDCPLPEGVVPGIVK